MRRGLLALLAVLAGLLLSATAVYAGIHTIPPKVIVKSGGQYLQTARVHEYGWYYYNSGEWIYSGGPGKPAYKYPKVTTSESVKVRLVFRFPIKPERAYVRTHGGDFIGHSLFYPVKNENGKVVAWSTYFYRTGHHRYVVRVKWPKAEGQSYGAATYTAHVTTR